MKTIFTLIFLGYLGCTFACYDDLSEDCLDLEDEAQFPFSADRFFFGDWYVTHLKKQTGSPECSKFETSIIGSIILKYQSRGQTVKCTADKHLLKKYICFDCDGSRSSFTKFFIVLETDSYYAEYALVYVCNESESTISGIISALSDIGLSQSDLKSNKCA
ncbi:dimiconin-like isoform X2 [Rhodnius prolixus]|uniref:dimiconin-like isoform X2 n=1 Tax=Rhodnius prolixus TaxID=13249 RepID=UPI003D18A91D